jgi:hypothetical protein
MRLCEYERVGVRELPAERGNVSVVAGPDGDIQSCGPGEVLSSHAVDKAIMGGVAWATGRKPVFFSFAARSLISIEDACEDAWMIAESGNRMIYADYRPRHE